MDSRKDSVICMYSTFVAEVYVGSIYISFRFQVA